MVVRKRLVRRRFQVLLLVPPRSCVPFQPPRFRWRIDGVDAGGGRDRTQSLSLRKTLPKKTPRTSLLCGIYSRLTPQ